MISLGELYLDGVVEDDERGFFAIICSHGVDGNVADVYGETPEMAETAARLIIHAQIIVEAVKERNRNVDNCCLCGTGDLSNHSDYCPFQARPVCAECGSVIQPGNRTEEREDGETICGDCYGRLYGQRDREDAKWQAGDYYYGWWKEDWPR